MTPDDDLTRDGDASLRELIAAGRRETPRSDVRERAYERALASAGEAPRRNALPGVILALAAVVALALGVRAVRRPPQSVAPETVPLAHTNPTPDLPRAPEPAASSPDESTAEPKPADKPLAPRPAPTLGDEVAQLAAARAALAGGDPQRALVLLDRYTRSTRGVRLGDEALVLRLDALTQAGRGAEASALARDFVAKNPGSPLVDRARAFIAAPAPSSTATAKGTAP